MNLVIIGNDTDNIALDIWKGNTNYTVLNKNPIMSGKSFLDYIHGKEIIVSTTAEQFESVGINNFVEYMDKQNFIPIFIADKPGSLETYMYTAVEELLPNSILYTRNKNNEQYDELIKIGQNYLNGKGIIKNENNALRAPKERKRRSIKK